jgi:hypothetical protein
MSTNSSGGGANDPGTVSPDEETTALEFPRLRESVSTLVRTVSTSLRTVRLTVARTTEPPSGFARKVTVLLVDSDRLERASIARTLVNARFDVTAIDSSARMLDALAGRADGVVAMVSLEEAGVVRDLRGFVHTYPSVPVIGWSDAPRVAARAILATAGAHRSLVVSKGASAAEVVVAIRRVLTVYGPSEEGPSL